MKLFQRILSAHNNVCSLSPTDAKLSFIKAWQTLPHHGITYFIVRFKGLKKEVCLSSSSAFILSWSSSSLSSIVITFGQGMGDELHNDIYFGWGSKDWTTFRLGKQKLVKNNQDNQIQNITLCNMYFSKKVYAVYSGVWDKAPEAGKFSRVRWSPGRRSAVKRRSWWSCICDVKMQTNVIFLLNICQNT